MPAAGRPFSLATWQLEEASLASLGWSAADEAALVTAQQTAPPAPSTTTAAAPGATSGE